MSETYLIGNDTKRRGWFVTFYNQWPAIFRPHENNWQDWSFYMIKIAGENSPYKRSWEVELALLGLHLLIVCVYRDSDEH